MKGVLERIQQWWNGPFEEPDPRLPAALKASEESLRNALATSTEVNEIVRSVVEEEKKNHFMELLFPVVNRKEA